MEVPPTSPLRRDRRNVEKAPTPSVNTLVARAAVFVATQEVQQATPEAHRPTPEALPPSTSQPAAMDAQNAIEELKVSLLKCKGRTQFHIHGQLSVPGVDPDRIFYRKGLVPMRLNEEAGKGESPVLVMNDEVCVKTRDLALLICLFSLHILGMNRSPSNRPRCVHERTLDFRL
jgi:hypothetical protein